MESDYPEEQFCDGDHTPQGLLTLLLTLIFVVLVVFLCLLV